MIMRTFAAIGAIGFLSACANEVPGPVSFAEALDREAAHLVVHFAPSTGFAHPLGHDGEIESGSAFEPDEMTGVTAELMKAFAAWVESTRGLDVTLTFEAEPRWAVFYERVRDADPGVFGLGNVTITEERRGELAFSPPYLANVATLITHEDAPELDALSAISEAFRGMTGLLYPGTLHEVRLEALRDERFPEMPTVEVETNDELVARAASGEGYFGYIDIYNYWRAVEEGRPLRRHAVADDASETFGIIMPRGSDWAPVMDAFFEAHDGILGTEWYGALLEEHLGAALADMLHGS